MNIEKQPSPERKEKLVEALKELIKKAEEYAFPSSESSPAKEEVLNQLASITADYLNELSQNRENLSIYIQLKSSLDTFFQHDRAIHGESTKYNFIIFLLKALCFAIAAPHREVNQEAFNQFAQNTNTESWMIGKALQENNREYLKENIYMLAQRFLNISGTTEEAQTIEDIAQTLEKVYSLLSR